MDTADILSKEFSAQDFTAGQPPLELLQTYKDIACNYARIENAVAVLSDLRTNVSYVYYGGFSQMLGLNHPTQDCKLPSIWEEEIFRLVHPDDLARKHLHELCFFHFIKRQCKSRRAHYYLMSKMRMKSASKGYIPVLHRMFYIPLPSNDTLWLALCLYSPLSFDLSQCLIVNSINGQTIELEKQHNTRILSEREKQVLRLIDKGQTSKDIAGMLSISVNTVSRHRQEILGKLQVKNSIEACRIAKELGII